MVLAGKLRLKGRLHGQSFNVAPGSADWQVCPTTAPGDLVLCYLAPDTPWPPALLSLVASRPEPARSHQLLRVDTDHEATVSTLQKGMAALQEWEPHVTELHDGRHRLTTHPEQLQLWKEMARRPGVKTEWFGPVIAACLEYWTKCASWLRDHAALVDPAHLPTHQRELGVSIAWWALEFSDQLSDDLSARIHATRPAVLVAAGLEEITALRSDPFWSYWQGLEYLRALRFGGSVVDRDAPRTIHAAAHRVIGMARNDDERAAFATEWEGAAVETKRRRPAGWFGSRWLGQALRALRRPGRRPRQ